MPTLQEQTPVALTICLRAPYAMSGIDIVYEARRPVLRSQWYLKSGTEMVYGAQAHDHWITRESDCLVASLQVSLYAISGTATWAPYAMPGTAIWVHYAKSDTAIGVAYAMSGTAISEATPAPRCLVLR
eukprot:3941188-Rhodomonas_salina.3